MTGGETVIPTAQGDLFACMWSPERAADPALPPIILIHDSLGCVALWREFPAHLAERTGRQIVAYDRLGFGRSPARQDRLEPLTFITDEATGDFRAVIDHLDIKDFIAIGHSVGGSMAIAVAAAYPERCKALVTMAAQTFVEPQTFTGVRAAKSIFAQPDQRDRLRKYHGDKVEWVLDAWIETWLDPAFQAWSLDSQIEAVTCPTLAIHGAKDEYGSPAHPRRMVQRAAGPTTLMILPDEGHFPHRGREDAVLAEISKVLGS